MTDIPLQSWAEIYLKMTYNVNVIENSLKALESHMVSQRKFMYVRLW